VQLCTLFRALSGYTRSASVNTYSRLQNVTAQPKQVPFYTQLQALIRRYSDSRKLNKFTASQYLKQGKKKLL
jgi:hypothetical protein